MLTANSLSSLDIKEILKKVRLIELKTNRLVDNLFYGQYLSSFKGQGIEFTEVKEYCFGDEIRNIDWNVTARIGSPFVKRFVEEREMTIILLFDGSGSVFFGSEDQLKKEMAVDFCATIIFSAMKNNDRVGLIIFSDRIDKFIPPKKGRKHALLLLRELIGHQKDNPSPTNFTHAIDYLNRVFKRKATVFFISDFIDFKVEKALKVTTIKHDLIAVMIKDPREYVIPQAGYLRLRDTETGEELLINTNRKDIREAFTQLVKEEDEKTARLFKKFKIDTITLSTDKPFINPLVDFFQQRLRRRR